MNEKFPHSDKLSGNLARRSRGWLMLPLSFFAFAALLTYDWHAIEALQLPAHPSTNWIGAIGDAFAYGGYRSIGLTIWLVPAIMFSGGLFNLIRHPLRLPGRRFRRLWYLAFLVAAACLVEISAVHAAGLNTLTAKVNADSPGGAIGYLLMSRILCPLIGAYGATISLSILAAAALVLAIGPRELMETLADLWHWAIDKSHAAVQPRGGSAAEAGGDDNEADGLAAVERARADAKAQAAAERERIKEEKARRKVELAEAKAAAKTALAADPLDLPGIGETAAAAEKASDSAEAAPAQVAAVKMSAKPAAKAGRGKTAAAAEKTASEPVNNENYQLPSVDLLAPLKQSVADHSDVDMMTERIINTLKLYNIESTLSFTVLGPVITKYAIKLEPGTPYNKVTGRYNELKGALHARSLRIEGPIPGKEEVGIEVPNTKPAGISFREIFESETWQRAKEKFELPLLFGKDAAGKELVADLASMPHMLVAGATGQGKSVCLNSLICGLLMTRTPDQLKLIMVDPKSVEFAAYSQIPHLLIPVIADNNKVVKALQWAVVEMEKRLKMFTRARVRNIFDFNHRKSITQTDMFGNDTELGSDMPKTIPYIIVIIDEVADLMSQCAKVVTGPISRIAAKARAAGIHLILATQRPDAKVITGTIKANIPGRVAFKTASAIDSRTILDDSGAENLIGRGDMLFKGKDGILTRAQGSWISDDEIINVTGFIEKQSAPQFDETFAKNLARVQEAGVEDPFAELDQEDAKENRAAEREQLKAAAADADFKKALVCIINTKRASTSHFQRQMAWGYNHAAKILDQLSEAGVVSPQEGMGPRRIIMDEDAIRAMIESDDAAAADAEGGEPAGEQEDGAAADFADAADAVEGGAENETSVAAPEDFKLEG